MGFLGGVQGVFRGWRSCQRCLLRIVLLICIRVLVPLFVCVRVCVLRMSLHLVQFIYISALPLPLS